MTGKKLIRWITLPILLIGLFSGLGYDSNQVAASDVNPVERINDAWTSNGYNLVTVRSSTRDDNAYYDSSEMKLARSNAECVLNPTGIISHWPLNEKDGATKFADTVGGHPGHCEGSACPSKTKGVISGAFNFTAAEEDSIFVAASTDFDWLLEDSFSIGAWVKTTQDCSGNKVFLGRYRWTEGVWWIGCTPSQTDPAIGLAAFRLRDDNEEGNIARYVIGTSRINDGRWHFVVGVRDGSQDENHIYVDGKLERTATGPQYFGDFINSQRLTIGSYDDPKDYYLDGTLDEIVIYDRVLSAEEIASYYLACDPPEIYLPMIIR